MSERLREVADLVLRESGMAIRDPQLPALEAAIRRLGAGMTADRLLAEAQRPGADAEIVERLIDQVTIKETYFLRHQEELVSIDWRGLAARAMAAGRSTVRVWSAACASGEEPYSLAMLAHEAFAPGAPPVDILATDIAHSALERARAGRYGARSTRHVQPEQRSRWFTEHRDGLEAGPELRRLVRFGRHNLLHDRIPPAGEDSFDLVVCRNVLIYFKPEVVRQTIARLQAALVPEGVLLLGAADRLTGGPAIPAPRPAAPAAPPPERRRRRERRARPRPDRPERRAPVPETPLDADAELERGMVALAEGDHETAIDALRRAVYLDPRCAVGAFQLARAHDARGDAAAAVRAYRQALVLLEEREDELAGVARADLETAARTRLEALAEGRA